MTRSAIEPIRLRQSVLYLRLPFPRPGKYYFRNCRQPIPHKLSDKYAVSRQHCHLPKSCDTSARRQLLMFPSSTACIATDSNAQLSQHDSVLIALKPTTGGILLALTLTAAASTIPKCSCVKYLRQTSRPPRFCIVGIRSMACPISQLITAETSSTRWLPVRSYSCPSRLLFVHTKQSPTCMSLNL